MRKILITALFALVMLPMAAQADVPRHHFTRGITEREPVDQLNSATNINPLYYFTEITNMTGATVKHRWYYKNRLMATVEFKVQGPRWRVFSSKDLQPHWDGIWKVEVTDNTGAILATDTISVLID